MIKIILSLCFLFLLYGWITSNYEITNVAIWIILFIPVYRFIQKTIQFIKNKEYLMGGMGLLVMTLICLGLILGKSFQ